MPRACTLHVNAINGAIGSVVLPHMSHSSWLRGRGLCTMGHLAHDSQCTAPRLEWSTAHVFTGETHSYVLSVRSSVQNATRAQSLHA